MPQRVTKICLVSGQGELPQSTVDQINDELQLYAGRPVAITISPPVRSLQANAYLWGLVYPEFQRGLDAAGMPAASCDAIHAHFRDTLLPTTARQEVVMDRKVTVIDDPSTAQLNSTAFYEYVESVRLIARERLEWQIPDPDPEFRAWWKAADRAAKGEANDRDSRAT